MTETFGPDTELIGLLSNGLFDHSTVTSVPGSNGWTYTINASLNGNDFDLVIDLPDGASEDLVKAKVYKARNNYLTPLP